MKNNIAAGLAVSPHILKRLMERDMGAVMYMVIGMMVGMMVGSLYAIVVGPTTLKVPQPAMTFADFSIVWFIIGAAAVLALCVCSLTLSLTNR
jgi:putative membrane protein